MALVVTRPRILVSDRAVSVMVKSPGIHTELDGPNKQKRLVKEDTAQERRGWQGRLNCTLSDCQLTKTTRIKKERGEWTTM